MRRIPLTAALVALCGIPAVVAAQQGPLSVGGGYGITQSDQLSGGAAHVRVSMPLSRVGERLTMHGEVLAQQGTITGDPSTCARVAQGDCAGRSDRNRLFTAGTFLRWDVGNPASRVRMYLVPVGVGLYHRRTETEEQQGPFRTCISNGQVGACPDAAPFEVFSSEENRTSLGLNLGGGLEMQVGRVRLFADARFHRMVEGRGSWAGAAPFSVGVSF